MRIHAISREVYRIGHVCGERLNVKLLRAILRHARDIVISHTVHQSLDLAQMGGEVRRIHEAG